jgi:hypothetical protein
LLRIGCIGSQIFIIFFSLFFLYTNAASNKEFGSQNNIYLSDWARLKHQAELGDPAALFVLGNFYYQPPKGSSFRVNLKKSAEYYFKSGIRGNAAAQYNLALMFHEGLGVQKNTVESYAWFKLASLNQSPVAKHINRVSAKAIIAIESQLSVDILAAAKKRVAFYTDIIDKKLYRKAPFPS